MNRTVKSLISIITVAAALLVLCTSFASATETEIIEGSSRLEIDLGPDSSGAAFWLKTDGGIMPDKLIADEDGKIQVDIGGSSKYILTYAGTETADHTETVTETETASVTNVETSATTATTATDEVESSETAESPSGIPAKDLIIFVSGLVIFGGFLIANKLKLIDRIKNRKQGPDDDTDSSDDEDE